MCQGYVKVQYINFGCSSHTAKKLNEHWNKQLMLSKTQREELVEVLHGFKAAGQPPLICLLNAASFPEIFK